MAEQQYLLRGRNPYDMWLEHSPWAHQAGLSQRSGRRADVEADLGISDPHTRHGPGSVGIRTPRLERFGDGAGPQQADALWPVPAHPSVGASLANAWLGAAYLAGASVVTWAVVGVDPLTMLRELLTVGAVIGTEGNLNTAKLLLSTGLPREAATVAAMVAVLVPAWALLFKCSAREPVVAFAVAGLAGRLWTYHKTYDDLILVFPLFALGQRAIDEQDRRLKWILALGFLCVGATLWLPPRLAALPEVRPAKLVVWIVAVGVLLMANRRGRQASS